MRQGAVGNSRVHEVPEKELGSLRRRSEVAVQYPAAPQPCAEFPTSGPGEPRPAARTSGVVQDRGGDIHFKPDEGVIGP